MKKELIFRESTENGHEFIDQLCGLIKLFVNCYISRRLTRSISTSIQIPQVLTILSCVDYFSDVDTCGFYIIHCTTHMVIYTI